MNHHVSHSSWQRVRTFYDTAGTRVPQDAAVRIADLIRSKSNQTDPPFQARLYCEPYNVEIEDQWLIDCDARLLPIPGGYIAEVQANHSAVRKQFSICHELAHVFFNSETSGSNGFSCATGSGAQALEERLCDRVAVELLMPQPVFRAYAEGMTVEFASIRQLAETFQVSLQAVIKRIVELNVWPCGFVNFKLNQRGALNLESWRVSEAWRDSSRSCYSANQLGNAIRNARNRKPPLVIAQCARSVRVEWYQYGVRSKAPLICAFLSALSVE